MFSCHLLVQSYQMCTGSETPNWRGWPPWVLVCSKLKAVQWIQQSLPQLPSPQPGEQVSQLLVSFQEGLNDAHTGSYGPFHG